MTDLRYNVLRSEDSIKFINYLQHNALRPGDKTSGIALQFSIQKWPSCYASLKCRATRCNAVSKIILYNLVIFA